MALFKLKGLRKEFESNTYEAPSGQKYRFWNPSRNNPKEVTEVKEERDIAHFRAQPNTFEEITLPEQAANAAKGVVEKAAAIITPGAKRKG